MTACGVWRGWKKKKKKKKNWKNSWGQGRPAQPLNNLNWCSFWSMRCHYVAGSKQTYAYVTCHLVCSNFPLWTCETELGVEVEFERTTKMAQWDGKMKGKMSIFKKARVGFNFSKLIIFWINVILTATCPVGRDILEALNNLTVNFPDVSRIKLRTTNLRICLTSILRKNWGHKLEDKTGSDGGANFFLTYWNASGSTLTLELSQYKALCQGTLIFRSAYSACFAHSDVFNSACSTPLRRAHLCYSSKTSSYSVVTLQTPFHSYVYFYFTPISIFTFIFIFILISPCLAFYIRGLSFHFTI
jgi:hypothetical protein